MKTFFKYFLPWCFKKATRGIVNLQNSYFDLFADNAFIGALFGVLITSVLVLLTLGATETYSGLHHLTQEARNASLDITVPLAILVGICYTFIIGIMTAFKAFQKEQQDFLDKLSGKYENDH